MTIPAGYAPSTYNGNGVTVDFALPHKAEDADDVVVTLTDASGVNTVQSAYTVAGIGDADGITVTMTTAPATGETLTIALDPVTEQQTHFLPLGIFPSENTESALDRLTRVAQVHRQKIDRSIRAPDTDDALSELPTASVRASRFAAFDSNGDVTTSAGTGVDAGLRQDLADGDAALVGSTAISYIQTLAEDAALVTPVNYYYPAGHAYRYGASTTASAAVNAAAFQDALDSHPDLFYLPKGTHDYNVKLTTTVGVHVHMRGDHGRDCIMNWTGGATECINFATETEPVFEGIRLDNNGTATIGIQCDSLRATFRDFIWLPVIAYTTAAINSRVADVVEMWDFSDIYIAGYAGQRSARGVWLHQGNAFTFRRCVFDDLETGLQAGAANGGGVQSGLVSGLDVGGGCLFQHGSATSIGLDLYHVQGFNVGGAIFEFDLTNQLSIKCRTAIGGSIDGCWMNGAGAQNYGIECADATSKNIDIKNNSFDRIVLAGALISAGTDIWPSNNSLTSTAMQAVQTNNTFTPGVAFGGGTTGITYGARVCRKRRYGNTMHVQGSITLTNKGSSTGVVTITDLPNFSDDTAGNTAVFVVGLDSAASLSGSTYGLMDVSAKIVRIYQSNTGTAAQLTDANFTNTTVIFFSGTYQVLDV